MRQLQNFREALGGMAERFKLRQRMRGGSYLIKTSGLRCTLNQKRNWFLYNTGLN